MTRLRADLLLLLVAMIWGFAFVGQSSAMAHTGPLAFTGWRFALAALIVAPLAVREMRRPQSRAVMRKGRVGAIIALGAVFFAASLLQQYGLLATRVTNAGFLTALYVVMAPIIGFAFLRHRPPAVIWIGAGLSLIGAFFLSGGSIVGLNPGDVLVVISAVFWAVQILLIGWLLERADQPVTLAFAQFAVSAIAGIALSLIFEAPELPPFSAIWRELLFTGVLSGAVCFTLQTVAQKHTPASDAAILMSTEALFAALGGAVFFKDRLDEMGWTGCALIIGAVLLVQLAPYWGRKSAH
jgi:drug/metabolite transporter (DMT)-like permease